MQLGAIHPVLMRISLYSGPACWIMVLAGCHSVAAFTACGPLQFEGTVPSQLIAKDIWTPLLSECQENSYAEISEDLGLTLLDETLRRYGTLTLAPPDQVKESS